MLVGSNEDININLLSQINGVHHSQATVMLIISKQISKFLQQNECTLTLPLIGFS